MFNKGSDSGLEFSAFVSDSPRKARKQSRLANNFTTSPVTPKPASTPQPPENRPTGYPHTSPRPASYAQPASSRPAGSPPARKKKPFFLKPIVWIVLAIGIALLMKPEWFFAQKDSQADTPTPTVIPTPSVSEPPAIPEPEEKEFFESALTGDEIMLEAGETAFATDVDITPSVSGTVENTAFGNIACVYITADSKVDSTFVIHHEFALLTTSGMLFESTTLGPDDSLSVEVLDTGESATLPACFKVEEAGDLLLRFRDDATSGDPVFYLWPVTVE
ncbi:MAG: hypothetical protein GX483_06160 [Actinomycetaceae bacterium]|nr:hypothetical protein [Actinomycetaceae bacterium]